MQFMTAAFMAAHIAASAPPQQDADVLRKETAAAPALNDEAIRKAVRDTVAAEPAPVTRQEAGAFHGDGVHERMTAAFNQAKVPDCLHGDALKLQPAMIGPVAVVGEYALPWVIAAAVRGKCR